MKINKKHKEQKGLQSIKKRLQKTKLFIPIALSIYFDHIGNGVMKSSSINKKA